MTSREQNPSAALLDRVDRLRRLFDDSRDADPAVEYALHEFLDSHYRADLVGPIAPNPVQRFSHTAIPDDGIEPAAYFSFLLREVVPYSVKTHHPRFIGHMTSALPAFVHPVNRLMTFLNQNVVKLETSNAFTYLERQAVAMVHRIVYERDDAFYAQHAQANASTLGLVVSGGTLANLAALWCARNQRLGGNGRAVEQLGIAEATRLAGYTSSAVICSRLAHYSIAKAVDVLGIGLANRIDIPVDTDGRMRLPLLRDALQRCRDRGIAVVSVIGLAGATETGQVDPLPGVADLCEEFGCHLHVDAAWGGPVLLSRKHKSLLDGIARADTVTLDGHKQLYLPMGIGCVIMRDPGLATAIEKKASYIIREGSMDLGRRTLEGSRPAMSLQLHAGLHVMGRSAYASLIEHGIALARFMADEIRSSTSFELLHEPVMNIVAYRYAPGGGRRDAAKNEQLNMLNRQLQERQSAAGMGFVSRTTLEHTSQGEGVPIVALRSVLASPRTTHVDIKRVLQEQVELGAAIEAEV